MRIYLTGASGFVGSNLAHGVEAIPRDTRLDATVTAQALGAERSSLESMLSKLRQEFDEPNGNATAPLEVPV